MIEMENENSLAENINKMSRRKNFFDLKFP